MSHVFVPTMSEGYNRSIEQAWERTLAVAQNHVQAFDDQGRQPPTQPQDTQSSRASSEFYDRERHMMQALDVLFGYAHEGPGYLAFMQAMTMILDPDSPVAMAFLSHIIERSALPSKHTMESISPVILNTLKQAGTHRRPSGPFFKRLLSSMGVPLKSDQPPVVALTRIKLNATVIWSLLAEKYAGEMCMHMWNDQVGQLLIQMLVDVNEDLMVRLFSLMALEKFSLTGTIKNIILETSDIQNVLQQVIDECDKANQGFYAMTRYLLDPIKSDEPRRLRVDTRQPSLEQAKDEQRNEHSTALWGTIKQLVQSSTGWRRSSSQHKSSTISTASSSQPITKFDVLAFATPIKKQPVSPTFMNSFDTGFIPPPGPIREAWAKYLQLSFCARWALENVFNEGKQHINSTPWNLSHIRTIMNPFDATPHWKFGINGLELRNDRPHFESIRATASVKTGKWYYEALLLSSGIMQLGWATSRCRFSPEEGYGVGDDCNGFAFDTYRTAVWADGTAVYPQIKLKVRCQSGDVLGSYLDLDNGLCSYFINGKDLGLTIEFENPTKQAAKANAEAAAASVENTESPSTTASSPTSTTSSSSLDQPSSPLDPPSHRSGQQRHYRHHHHYHNYRQIPSQEVGTSSSTETFKTAQSSPEREAPPRSAKGLGLYPAVSLTTHQHVLINLGDRPWIYPPPITARYRGISEAGRLDSDYRRRVLRWVNQRGYRIRKLHLADHHSTIRPHKSAHGEPTGTGCCYYNSSNDDYSSESPVSITSTDSTDSLVEYDWDGPLCTICFSEPKNVIILPCQHGGIGQNCAKLLDMCHLCRSVIEDRVMTKDVDEDATSMVDGM
ncbi:hypothetical protein BC941DRAFT_87839 [Chlamydoabsidia padenii]|nr:hypothetical protein BC941DRAFT_87839 [Chlamydoabsidia padenii]